MSGAAEPHGLLPQAPLLFVQEGACGFPGDALNLCSSAAGSSLQS
jgi:hypothetical protein